MYLGKSKLMNTFKKVTQFLQYINYKKKKEIFKTEIISYLLHLVSFPTLSWASHSTGLKSKPHTHKPFVTWILTISSNAPHHLLRCPWPSSHPEVFSVLQICHACLGIFVSEIPSAWKALPPGSSAGLAFSCYLGFRRPVLALPNASRYSVITYDTILFRRCHFITDR